MFHPLISVLIRKPDLVMEHLAGYGALVHEEVAAVGSELVHRAIAWGVAGVMGAVFVTLAGIAAMLGAVNGSAHWALFVVPLIALVIAVIAVVMARKPLSATRFEEIKAQVDADIVALRAAGDRK
ncbi:phage holin family protein [uncultured Xylophilus sp.]|uniref:phage holin family protein n=1 Tax=uncultured Xylophilus sp. TaxID=296832 RepID=UPI0025D304FE|nr:phage holin family protein [uncultured Xylophilus sp.]